MFEGNHCRYLKVGQDNQLYGMMGNRTIEELAEDFMFDAGTPEQLDALAYQMDLCATRCRSRDFHEAGDRWRDAASEARVAAAEARARLAALPSRATHPGFYDKRSATPPGHLDSDLFMPLAVRLHLGRETMAHAIYEPELRDGMVYSVGPTRLGYTFLTPADGGRAFKLKTGILRGLMAMGRTEAVPLSALRKAA